MDKLSWFQEVLFYRLIVNVDDYGRMDARPAILRARLFPLKDITCEEISEALAALQTAGCVQLYEVNGAPYVCLPRWEAHQNIRAKRSKFPAPPTSACKCMQMRANVPVIQSESESESESESAETAFEAFWKQYPRKQRKYNAWQEWLRLKPDEALQARIAKAVEAARHSKQWQRDNGTYIPTPDNYLRDRRWEDAVKPAGGMVASTLDTAAMDKLAMTFVPRMGDA